MIHWTSFKRALCRVTVLLAVACAGSARAATGWQLTWSDEFEGTNGSAPSTARWGYDLGNGINGWGNGELECYTLNRSNSWIEDGALVIAARKETSVCGGVTHDYTSARLKTQQKFWQTYGRFEARMRTPAGQGLWPAFWMLGTNFTTVSWPACGELDVMENIGSDPARVFVAAHGPGYSGSGALTTYYTIPTTPNFSQGYHTFAMDWYPDRIRWFADGVQVQAVTPASLPAGAPWVFNHPFYLILNLAVGGSVPGKPSTSTVFPALLKVDYVRVYSQISAPAPTLLPIASTNGTVQLRWPGQYPQALLQRTPRLGQNWTNYATYAPLVGGEYMLSVGPGIYRLRLPPE